MHKKKTNQQLTDLVGTNDSTLGPFIHFKAQKLITLLYTFSKFYKIVLKLKTKKFISTTLP